MVLQVIVRAWDVREYQECVSCGGLTLLGYGQTVVAIIDAPVENKPLDSSLATCMKMVMPK